MNEFKELIWTSCCKLLAWLKCCVKDCLHRWRNTSIWVHHLLQVWTASGWWTQVYCSESIQLGRMLLTNTNITQCYEGSARTVVQKCFKVDGIWHLSNLNVRELFDMNCSLLVDPRSFWLESHHRLHLLSSLMFCVSVFARQPSRRVIFRPRLHLFISSCFPLDLDYYQAEIYCCMWASITDCVI